MSLALTTFTERYRKKPLRAVIRPMFSLLIVVLINRCFAIGCIWDTRRLNSPVRGEIFFGEKRTALGKENYATVVS